MLKSIKVEIPKKGCIVTCHNAKGIPYVYYATRYYRDEFKRPRVTRVLIGKKDLETGLLIPNDNYFDLFDEEIIIRKKDSSNE
jgi:hypothetical protein